jgi:hypothetical protein
MRRRYFSNKSLLFLLGLSLFLVMSACTVQSAKIAPPVEFNDEYLNQQIRLVPLEHLSTLKTSDPIALYLQYNSENTITFASNYSLRIFIKQGNQWNEIQERPTERFPGTDIVLSPNDAASYSNIVTFFPDLDDLNKKYNMRVYVFGDMATNGEMIEVASFVDILLTP